MRLIDADALQKAIIKAFAINNEAYLLEGSEKKIWELINKAQTIKPERKAGKWITYTKGSVVTAYKCSECGRTVRDDTGYDVAKDYPFCHCGADMRGDSNEIHH